MTMYTNLFLFYGFNVCHPEVFNTYINIQWCISQTQQNFIMFIIVLGQHVSIFIESSSGLSKNTDAHISSSGSILCSSLKLQFKTLIDLLRYINLVTNLCEQMSKIYINPSAWGHLNPSSYCDVGRLFYGVFKLWSKLQRKKWRNNF